MSIPLNSVDLSNATVGTTGQVSWAAEAAQMGGGGGPHALSSRGHLHVFNESGCGLRVTIGGNGYILAAGAWTILPIQGSTTTLNYTVEYVLSGQPVSLLLMVLYAPGEVVPPVPILGNSPVGGSILTNGSVAAAIEQDLLTPFVLTGYTAAKDGSVANQLDVAAGVAFLRQSDQSLQRIALNATNVLTSAGSATYYLDLQPDGTLSFSTNHSTQANYLTIATVTTDASGNIATVTDTRTTAATLLSAMAGTLKLPTNTEFTNTPVISETGPGVKYINTENGGHTWFGFVRSSGIGSGNNFSLFDATSNITALNVDPNGNLTPAGRILSLAGQNTAGSFGVPVIVAQALNTHVTATTQQTILSYTPSVTGHYRINLYAAIHNSSGSGGVVVGVFYDDPYIGAGQNLYLIGVDNAGVQAISGVTISNQNPIIASAMVYCAAGHAIQVFFQDNIATPNDYITAIIERMA